MPIRTQSADGATHEFPDDTPPEAVDKAMKSYAEEHQDKSTTLGEIGHGMMDPLVGAGQLAAHIAPGDAPGDAKIRAKKEARGERVHVSPDEEHIDSWVKEREEQIQKERGGSKNIDFARMAGEALSPVNFLGGMGAARVGEAAVAPITNRLLSSGLNLGAKTAAGATAAGGAAGAFDPVMDTKNFAKEKLQQVGLGSMFGGAVGAGGGAAAAGLSGWGSYIARTHPDNLMSDAVVKILKRIKQDQKAGGPSATDALDLVNAASKPIALVDVGGENLKGLGGNVYRQPGESRAIAKTFLTERDKQAGERLQQDISKHVTSGPTAFQATEGLLESRSMASAPLYKEAHALENVWSPRLEQLFEVPQIKQGLQAGYDLESILSAARGEPLTASQMGVDVGVDGTVKMTGKPNMRLLDMAKQGLDAMVSDARDPITGRLSKQGYALNELRNAYVTALDEADKSGIYKKARQTWGGYSSAMDAIKLGKSVFASHPEELAAEVSKMSPGDREFFKLGTADIMRERLLKAGFAGDESKRLMNDNGWVKKQLRPAFDKASELDAFVDAVTTERGMFDTKGEIMGGSQTAGRGAEDAVSNEGLVAAGKMAAHAAAGSVLGAVKSAWKLYQDIGLKPNPQLNEKIAQILFTTDVPEDAAKMLRSGVIPPRVNPKAGAAGNTADASVIMGNQAGGASTELNRQQPQ